MHNHSIRASEMVLVTKVTLYGISGSLSWKYIHAAYFRYMLLSLVSHCTFYFHVIHCGKVVGSCASHFGGHGFDSCSSYRLSLLRSLVLVYISSRLLLRYLFKNRPHWQSDNKVPCRLRTDTHRVRRKLLYFLYCITLFISFWKLYNIVFGGMLHLIQRIGSSWSSSVSWNILLWRVIITLGNGKSWFVWDRTTVCHKALRCYAGWVRTLLRKRNRLPSSIWKSVSVTLPAPTCKIHCKFSLLI